MAPPNSPVAPHFLNTIAAGQNLRVALQSALEDAIAALPIPKVMSYQLEDGTTTVQFVRPAHRLIAMRGHEVLPVTALGLLAGTTTHGHRFMAPGDLPVHSADTYAEQLREEGLIIASFAERRARIAELVQAAAATFDATPIMPDELLDEGSGLVEWPVVHDTGFEKEFLHDSWWIMTWVVKNGTGSLNLAGHW